MNSKICLIVVAAILGAIVVSTIVGNILESTSLWTRQNLGPKGVWTVKLFYLSLFVMLGTALVPLLIKYFLVLQIRIGNGATFPVKWLQAHERSIVYAIWVLIMLGLSIALPVAWRNGFFR